MKNVIRIAMMCTALSAYADVTPVPASKMAEFNAKTGGVVNPPVDIRQMLFLDARETEHSSLNNLVEAASKHIGLKAEVRQVSIGSEVEAYKIAKDSINAVTGAVVVFIENESAPSLSVFPEDAITVVNIHQLKDSDYQTYRRRLVKEFWRSIAFTLGGYACGGMQSVMQPVYSVKDLDAVKGFSIPPQQIGVINAIKPRLKIYNPVPVPYSRACREGWAPAPTNDVQKALYERFNTPTARYNADFLANPTVKRLH